MDTPLKTQKDRNFFVQDGFKYVRDRDLTDGVTTFWRCQWKIKKINPCLVRIYVKDGVIVKTLHVHNHESNSSGLKVTQIRNKIKKRAVKTWEIMQKELCMDHPKIWTFIDGLRSIEETRAKEYKEFVRGDDNSQKRRKYREADERIKVIFEGGFGEGGSRTILEYLRGLDHNFNMDH
jgi:hypothetical protein